MLWRTSILIVVLKDAIKIMNSKNIFRNQTIKLTHFSKEKPTYKTCLWLNIRYKKKENGKCKERERGHFFTFMWREDNFFHCEGKTIAKNKRKRKREIFFLLMWREDTSLKKNK